MASPLRRSVAGTIGISVSPDLRTVYMAQDDVAYQRAKRLLDIIVCLLILPFVLLTLAVCAH